jgi:hypothetical protein
LENFQIAILKSQHGETSEKVKMTEEELMRARQEHREGGREVERERERECVCV